MTNEKILEAIDIASMGVMLNEESHTYTKDGVVIPSVSEIMEPLNRMVYGDPQYAQYELGSNVHFAISAYINDGLEIWQQWDNIAPYCEAYLKWRESDGKDITILANEKPIAYDVVYAGTPDLIGFDGNRAIIVDFKTAKSAKWNLYAVQLEAYAHILNKAMMKIEGVVSPVIIDLAVLQLKADGTYRYEKYGHDRRLKAFICWQNLHDIRGYSRQRNNTKH